MLNAKIPSGPLENKWADYKGHCKLVNPANKRKLEVIVVGTGLAGASAAASLGELGYKVKAFCFQDSPRRAHSIAAQGGINAAKNYQNDGDSVFRLFYDTIKGGDYRAREANVHRLAEVSTNIIDQCVAQGVPFAREYGGLLSNRSFGGTQVQRTFYAAGQTGQQLLIGAYQALERQVALGNVTMYSRHEMLEVVTIDGKARGIIARDLVNGKLERHFGHAVLLCSGGYGNVFYLSTNAMGSNVTAAWKAHKKGAAFANPCFTQIHPTCIPVSGDHQSKLTLMSESLRNDGRIWVPKKQNDTRKATDIPEEERDYYLERRYPAFGNLVPRDVASRAAKERCDAGYGVGSSKQAVYLDYADAILRYGKIEAGKQGRSNVSEEEIIAMGKEVVKAKYGNLFDMYEKITGENPYEVPMRIYPAVHYTMGGLWVDYELQTTVPGLYALGEANFSDHGANRLGASALMQGLADGYFVIPYTLGNNLADEIYSKAIETTHPAFEEAEKAVSDRINHLMNIKGKQTVESFHKRLGKIMWDKCGMARNKEGLEQAIREIQALKKEFWSDVRIPGEVNEMNTELDKANRVADFIELGELMCVDALTRDESCGGHFREEFQTPEGEALRDDAGHMYVSAWELKGEHQWELHKEPLNYEVIKPTQRNYK
ncbi:MAG: succinate dehydrogenase flavoprotein subunit [Sphingobacteriia bacterium 24-36-13]|jgi:succinate dehydrogenase / fumarate reductase flavoprotein subunit|uniref:fumarate reductase/succinate dehydrogenase flavoprotein subunit n=1 Tax=Sediminibacterium sp. TaxID=1917865 RepID=UPI000BD75EED|nr:fumarate reductase/succinate dehydrogenase flavoprotein subunit [Sediminibacterium sp.]OYY11450.1 MAG: succinate dehydrogenase flavoprotein subunit [Sphingobacteriia bacterium 35-36-14]OYZ55499.1 MAG: succinate dehydrogenase flavoprotein subunit [Sphingobacteriia bacterium 24-36-13]OZA66045.1 MAG: succinate dehydrogenase flavoprotein subunit [Sphingobacteriia bacterium 39-36-14]HQS23538.1 fumarate reductase/succinate dehydrogenase flavoprotein subunit [Sediminibacterium sp.]HQS34244.1 fumar